MISLLFVAVNSALLGRTLFYSYKLFLDGYILHQDVYTKLMHPACSKSMHVLMYVDDGIIIHLSTIFLEDWSCFFYIRYLQMELSSFVSLNTSLVIQLLTTEIPQ